MRRALYALAALLGFLAIPLVLVTVRAATWTSRQIEVEPVAVEVDADAVAERLAAAVRFPTVSTQGGAVDEAAFAALHAWMREAYPRVFSDLVEHDTGTPTLWLTWEGSDPSLEPVLLLAHLDVVPVAPGTEGDWTHPPFAGVIADGVIWGRGTIDDKHAAIGLCEALEAALSEGMVPERTVHVVLGHDEEVGGTGAKRVAVALAGQRLAAVFDEGLPMVDGVVPGIDGVIALVGIAEKGYVTLELTARGTPGHSSRPPSRTAVGALATAIDRLVATPMPAALDPPGSQLFDWAGPEMGFTDRVIFGNQWLFAPAIVSQMTAGAGTNASVRTTTAPTVLRAGDKENVLPGEAMALVNFRIHPRDSIEGVVEHVVSVVDDPLISVEIAGDIASEPSIVSDFEGWGGRVLQRSYREVFPTVPVAPALMVAATDSRHFLGLSDQVFRTSPEPLTSAELDGLHGTDERIEVGEMADVVRFYSRLLRNVQTPGTPSQ